MVRARVLLLVAGVLFLGACQPMHVKMIHHLSNSGPSQNAIQSPAQSTGSMLPDKKISPTILHEPVQFTDIFLVEADAIRLRADGRASQVCPSVESTGDFVIRAVALDAKRNVYLYNPHLNSSEMPIIGQVDGKLFSLRNLNLVEQQPQGLPLEYIQSSQSEVLRFLDAQFECLKKDPPIDAAKLDAHNYEEALRARDNLFVGMSRFAKTLQEASEIPVGKGSFEVERYSDMRAHFIHVHLVESLNRTIHGDDGVVGRIMNAGQSILLFVGGAQAVKWLGGGARKVFPKTTGKVISGVGKVTGVSKFKGAIPVRLGSAVATGGALVGVAATFIGLVFDLQLLYWAVESSPTAPSDTFEGFYTSHHIQVGDTDVAIEGGLEKLLHKSEADLIQLFETHPRLAPTLIRLERGLVRLSPEKTEIFMD